MHADLVGAYLALALAGLAGALANKENLGSLVVGMMWGEISIPVGAGGAGVVGAAASRAGSVDGDGGDLQLWEER